MGRALLPVVALSIASQPFAQVFGDASNQIPQGSPENASLTAEVDFADVDLDGDWDAAFANGPLADQNRLWINRGGIQGGALGFFVDETAVRFPAVNDTSRDIEFADWDGDGDPDIATSNGSFAQDEASRLWANTGGGFFADETSTRWVGLGGAGSSIDPALVPATGGFVDWCFDTDFADFDADGDLDLFHGTLAVPATPSRIFLNDGAGFFTEFNPAGIQLVGPGIPNGTPAIWAEGVHAQGTLQVDGSEADIAEPLFDVELADVDGDLDLDVLLGSSSLPRLFRSRREENGGTLSFRDVTHAVLPPGWANAGNSYDQELGDLDGDGDLDLYGASWQGFDDRTFVNTGGVFGSATPVPASASDDDEVDFIDYDNDGDLDVYVAGFSGVDRLYQNDNNGGSSFSLSLVGPGASGVSTDSSHDIDVCDVDLDGDYDVMTARDAPNQLLLNRTQIPDTTAPRVPLVEVVPNQIAGPAGVRVRAQVYDNAPDYVTASSDVRIEVTIAGCPHLEVPMRWSGGQVFRGEIPGDLVGWIEYRVRATDRYGNSGVFGGERLRGFPPRHAGELRRRLPGRERSRSEPVPRVGPVRARRHAPPARARPRAIGSPVRRAHVRPPRPALPEARFRHDQRDRHAPVGLSDRRRPAGLRDHRHRLPGRTAARLQGLHPGLRLPWHSGELVLLERGARGRGSALTWKPSRQGPARGLLVGSSRRWRSAARGQLVVAPDSCPSGRAARGSRGFLGRRATTSPDRWSDDQPKEEALARGLVTDPGVATFSSAMNAPEVSIAPRATGGGGAAAVCAVRPSRVESPA